MEAKYKIGDNLLYFPIDDNGYKRHCAGKIEDVKQDPESGRIMYFIDTYKGWYYEDLLPEPPKHTLYSMEAKKIWKKTNS